MNTCILALLALALAADAPAESPAYVHDSVLSPVHDLINLGIPSEVGSNPSAQLGYLDITAAPFQADPTGRSDSTEAIQKAIDFARDHQMVCLFPPGTYTVSDTLHAIQGLYRRQHGVIIGALNFPCVLVGRCDPDGRRPKIILASSCPGFDDPNKPKYVVHFWTRSTESPETPQPNICFNQMFIGIDITISPGNPGAVAVRLRGAQGSGVQDCTIEAGDALTGLEGGCGSGGSHANITVRGGRIGLDLRETQPAPTITGITLINQKQTAILYGGRQTLCAVGVKIARDTPGPAITVAPEWDPYFQGPLTLIDSQITFTHPHPDNTAITANRPIYFNNVYLKNTATIAKLPKGDSFPGKPKGWLHITEYAQSLPVLPYKGLQYNCPIYLDGTPSSSQLLIIEPNRPAPDNLQSRHLWPIGFSTQPSRNSVNVKLPPYSATGDGQTDDTQALQKAIDENRCVFLPKGIYRISRTLQLRPHTRLFGVGNTFSVIAVRSDEGYFTDHTNPRPAVSTPSDVNADCSLAFCGIYVPFEVPGAYALEWSSGPESICRDVQFLLMPGTGYGRKTPPHEPRTTPFVRITGAGKWYNFELGTGLSDPGYRHLLIENASGPLNFYHLCPEGVRSEANTEIINSRNVSMYGLKGEGNTYMLWVRNSDRIRLFGYGGNASALPDSCLFKIENTPNFLLAGIIDQPIPAGKPAIRGAVGTDPRKSSIIIEQTPNQTFKTTPLDRPILYKQSHQK